MYQYLFFFFQAEDGIRDYKVTGVQTCALPISRRTAPSTWRAPSRPPDSVESSSTAMPCRRRRRVRSAASSKRPAPRSEEHTSELQSPCNLVCRLLLEKKKKQLTRRAWKATRTS